MKTILILPDMTQPWEGCIERRHAPDAATGRTVHFRGYRDCLRWEFGFSCAFCLCHETDLKPTGAESWGLTGIEHYFTQSGFPERRDDYSNCFYACSRCNRDRGTHPDEDDGRRLLNPCEADWSQKFKMVDFELQPREAADRDAQYTIDTYKLNADLKTFLRKWRLEAIGERLRIYREMLEEEEILFEEAHSGGEKFINSVQRLAGWRRKAYQALLAHSTIPSSDAPTSCRCGHTDHHTLPEVLEKQTWDLSDLTNPPAS